MLTLLDQGATGAAYSYELATEFVAAFGIACVIGYLLTRLR
jgi:F0F1-type ATP synthase assembly protein I